MEPLEDRSGALGVSHDNVSPYDADYYASHCGVPYTWDNPWWPEFFGRIADALVASIGPRSVLDAGCALGFLVSALRARGVDAHGVDLSEFAIESVPTDLRPFCRVGSLTEPFDREYDAVVCIEVLEHLLPAEAEPAIENICAHTGTVLFSSTPTDLTEPTHLNVQPPSYWSALFADRGFFRDTTFDAGVVAPHACLFVRRDVGAAELASAYEQIYVETRLREAALEQRIRTLVESAAHSIEADDRAALSEWQRIQLRPSWRVYLALVGLRARLAPAGTARDRALRRAGQVLVSVSDRAEDDTPGA